MVKDKKVNVCHSKTKQTYTQRYPNQIGNIYFNVCAVAVERKIKIKKKLQIKVTKKVIDKLTKQDKSKLKIRKIINRLNNTLQTKALLDKKHQQIRTLSFNQVRLY